MSERKLIAPLDLADFDPSTVPDNPGFADLINQELGNAATPDDGFEPVFEDLVGIVDSLDTGLALLGGADGGTLDDTFEEILALDDGPPHDNLVAATGDIPVGDAITADLGTLLGDSTGAGTPPSGGGGSATPSSDCSKRTNKYGLSKKGSFPGVTCDWPLTFQVLRVQDGPCTYSADPSPPPGQQTTVVITDFTLIQGDAAVWSLGHHTFHPNNAPALDVIDVKITPTKPGHYDAVGVLRTTRPTQSSHVCMSVDVIP